MKTPQTRSMFEKLLYVGIATFFLWPIIQLWSIKALPMFESDTYLRASVELENLLEEAMSQPFEKISPRMPFKKLERYSGLNLYGRVESFPHPDFDNMIMLRAQVRWGWFPFTRTLSIEHLRIRTRP